MKFFSSEPKPEAIKSEQGEGANEKSAQGMSRRSFLLGVAAVAAATQAVPAFAQDEQKIAKILVGEPKTYEEINVLVIKYIQGLGRIAKWSLVRELKAKADALIAILKSETNVNSPDVKRVIGESGSETKVILTTYIDGINLLPDNQKANALIKIVDLIQMIKVTDMGDIEKKLA